MWRGAGRGGAGIGIYNSGVPPFPADRLELLQQRVVRISWEAALKWSDRAKAFFYLVLFASALYWFYGGTWVDAWDAFLWLFAFLMLEVVVPDEDEDEPEPQGS